ncbi:ABC transporter substrate-binding protein [Chelatococcus sp. YT9]|uniref:ABC transporter substrate-binding protein n=1 Tax=Chelatococcus sp. YT9 TaxID=2835635 RepID=UPI001BCCDF1E|nr:ABC transporter substrate-binding protein [Chelatococcus sp. YT9]MBS7701256.1 ABC transporter substrate-binding protein [Chelatococcus sp. YT9]
MRNTIPGQSFKQVLRRVARTAVLAFAASSAAIAAAHAAEIKMVMPGNFASIDPHPATAVALNLSLASHIYDSLIVMDRDSKLSPGLATSWKPIDDHTWRFELRPNVRFPNGELVTPEVIRWNLERMRAPETRAINAVRYSLIKEIKEVGPNTFDIITEKPFPALPAQLTMFYIMSPTWAKTHDPAYQAEGTGPYKMVEYKAGDRIVLKAKDDYWGKKPPFEDVTFRIIPEPASRISALLAGEVDVITIIPTEEVDRINKSGRATAGSFPSNRSIIIKFDSLKAPFKDNNKLRQAINYAVDKDAIREAVWGGQGATSNCQILNSLYFGYNEDLKPYPYDPAKAKKLLSEAGYPNGLTINFEVPRGRFLGAEDISQAVAAQLGEIGIKVNIIEMEFSSYFSKLQAGGMANLGYMGTAWPTLDADGALTALLPGFPDAYYENDEFVALMDQARVEMDVEKRKDLYKKATASMCENPPVLFMYDQPTTYAVSNRVKGKARPDDWMRAWEYEPAKP